MRNVSQHLEKYNVFSLNIIISIYLESLLNNYVDKNIYMAYRDDGTKLDLPSGYSLKPVGRIENRQFSKLIDSSK